jgi:hypothetical protein
MKSFKYEKGKIRNMDWAKLLYVVVIAILYVPMVFLGANVFFPKYTGIEESMPYKDCYGPQRLIEQAPGAKVDLTCTGAMPEAGGQVQLKCSGASLPGQINEEALTSAQAQIDRCNEEQRHQQIAWEQERNKYDGWKYLSISIFNLLIILAVIFIGFKETVIMGLFFGAVAATFGATIRYWDYARTKIGFIVLVILFFIVLYFINKRQDKKK